MGGWPSKNQNAQWAGGCDNCPGAGLIYNFLETKKGRWKIRWHKGSPVETIFIFILGFRPLCTKILIAHHYHTLLTSHDQMDPNGCLGCLGGMISPQSSQMHRQMISAWEMYVWTVVGAHPYGTKNLTGGHFCSFQRLHMWLWIKKDYSPEV